AKALRMTATDLDAQLRNGQTVTDVAKARGVAAPKVKDAVAAAVKAQLDADVKAGRLTQAQADAAIADLKARSDANLGVGGMGRGMMDRDGFRGGRGGFRHMYWREAPGTSS
ncbi:MAG TPA: hypothetical protein VNT60_05170, partial [Deinococcales bacterium]|nr:hypothetical protein [Deinococcales bacterium]